MVFCSKCGNENEDGAVYCKNCGYLLKKEEPIQEKQSLLALIKIKPIIFGGITTIIFYVLFFSIYAFIGQGLLMTSAFFAIFMPMVLGGFVAGFNSDSDSLSGILNGVVIAILASLLVLLLSTLTIFVVALIIFVASGAAGGFVGVQIKKRIY